MNKTYEDRWGHPRYKKCCGNARKAKRRLEAESRAVERSKRSNAEQLLLCRSRRGLSIKETSRLRRLG